ncbi:hypothetical protein ACFSHR_26245 [Azotobacter chroococcum]
MNAEEIRARTAENERLGCAVRISNFGAAPRTKTRADRCPVHGEFDRTLVEAFEETTG